MADISVKIDINTGCFFFKLVENFQKLSFSISVNSVIFKIFFEYTVSILTF